MATNAQAGHLVDPAHVVNVPRLVTAYFTEKPDPAIPSQRVAFGTSGHRGSAFHMAFNEAHVLAITQAICMYRRHHSINGPLFVGKDTHALSEPAFASVLEALAANNVDTLIDEHASYTPTPVVSHAILTYNNGRASGLADGILITPSHNPPEDGGFKYNPPPAVRRTLTRHDGSKVLPTPFLRTIFVVFLVSPIHVHGRPNTFALMTTSTATSAT